MKYYCSFAKGAWNADEWQLVRSPRWKETSHWIQKDDCIANHLPDDLRPEDMQMGRDRTGESYISMLLKQPFHGSASFRLDCAFDSRMAPLLVFSRKLVSIHEDHLEVVLYDHGINLWHHYWDGEKPSWKLLAYSEADLEQGKRYTLETSFIFNEKGIFLDMSCATAHVGCRLDSDWPLDYYAGFTGCEGHNRFFEFEAGEGIKLNDIRAERFSD